MFLAIAASGKGVLYPSDRLSSGLLTCVCQDRYGYVWVGTEYGLNKFDGYRFTTYLHSQRDSATISDNEIASLFVDRKGRLWVGCSRGLVCYDYEHDQFRRYRFPNNLTPRVNSMAETSSGKLLVGTAGYGLYSVNPNGYLDYESDFNHQREDPFYSKIHIDREGNLWSSNHQPAITRFTLLHDKPSVVCSYQSSCGQPVCYIENTPQQLLIVCKHGILAYDYPTGSFSDAGYELSQLSRNTSIEDACRTPDGDLYIATQGGGLMMIGKGSRELTRVGYNDAHVNLNTAQAVDLMVDKDRHLWIACYNKGLMMLSHDVTPFSTWSLSSQLYVTGGGVTSMVPGNSDDTWCLVQNEGVFCFNSKGRVIAHREAPTGARLIYRSRKGDYWLAAENVVYRYNPATGSTSPELTLSCREINCICEDAAGHLYISTFESGFYVYDPVSRKGRQFSMKQTGGKDGYLCNDWIKAMLVDSRNLLWLCTTSGISMMQPERYAFNSRGWNVLLEGIQCYSVCETADGDMLFGTEEGLYRYDWKRNTIAKTPASRRLGDKMICAMVCDRASHDIWLSTNHGIWQYRPKTDSLVCHTGEDGLTAQEFLLGAASIVAADRIMFGTADGVVTFQPSAVASRVVQLGKPYLTHITVNGRALNALTDSYELRASDNSLTMEFSLLNYHNAENISFQYRLNDIDNWIQNGEGVNQLTFNQLPPGKYRIEVRAAAGNQVSSASRVLHLQILPPWYLSAWAYAFRVHQKPAPRYGRPAHP